MIPMVIALQPVAVAGLKDAAVLAAHQTVLVTVAAPPAPVKAKPVLILVAGLAVAPKPVVPPTVTVKPVGETVVAAAVVPAPVEIPVLIPIVLPRLRLRSQLFAPANLWSAVRGRWLWAGRGRPVRPNLP